MSAPSDLAGLDGLRELAGRSWPLFGEASGGDTADDGVALASRLREAIGVLEVPAETVPEAFDEWSRDGIDGVALRWDVGFGAPAEGWLLRPAGERGPLPGVLALHCHGGAKWFGKEKIADGPGPTPAWVQSYRDELYGGRAYPNDLARGGRAVLVHDVFGWGSRRHDVATMSWRSERTAGLELAERRASGVETDEIAAYDIHAGPHEDALAKTLGVLGTSWAGVIAREDLIALDALEASADVSSVTAIGLSGGGARAATLSALSDRLAAAVVIAMMSTLDPVLDGYVHSHTWALLTPGLGRVGDWPDVAAARAPRPLFVGYAERDALFPAQGMREAHERIASSYARLRRDDAYHGVFRDAPHSFDSELQGIVARWLDDIPFDDTQKEQTR